MVRFSIQLSLILLREMTVVGSHIFLFVVLQTLFAALEMGSLSGRQFIVFHAIGDAILLVLFAPIDLIDAGMAGIDLSRTGARSVAGLSLSSSRSDDK